MLPLQPRRLLILMARWPVPLRCKSRLAAGLGPQRAARVQQRLLQHGLGVMALAAQRQGIALRLAMAGVGPRAALREARRLGLGDVVLQGQGCLGVRLQRQFGRAFATGHQQVVLVGSDLPQLAPADLVGAFAALERHPLVLGPAVDGGYWLIGLRRPAPPLFCGVAWGGEQVLAQTLSRAEGMGLDWALLRQQADLDRPGDLLPWRCL